MKSSAVCAMMFTCIILRQIAGLMQFLDFSIEFTSNFSDDSSVSFYLGNNEFATRHGRSITIDSKLIISIAETLEAKMDEEEE